MAWLFIPAAVLLVGAPLLVARALRRRRAGQGWRRWEAQRRSGALAWTLFRRRVRTLRLTDRREP